MLVLTFHLVLESIFDVSWLCTAGLRVSGDFSFFTVYPGGRAKIKDFQIKLGGGARL